MPPGSSLTLNSLQLLNKTEKISARYILYLLFHLCVKFCICGIKITPGSTTAAAPALAPQVCLSSLLFILCNRFKLLLATRVFLQTGTWPLSSHRSAENDSLGVKAAASAETGASCPLEDAAAVSPKEREWILPCRVCRGTSQAICHSRHVSVCVWGGGAMGWQGNGHIVIPPGIIRPLPIGPEESVDSKQVPPMVSTDHQIVEYIHIRMFCNLFSDYLI